MTVPDPPRRLANHVVLDHVRLTFSVDGFEFPYWIAPDIQVRGVGDDGPPAIGVWLLTENLTVVTADGETTYRCPWPPPPGTPPSSVPRPDHH